MTAKYTYSVQTLIGDEWSNIPFMDNKNLSFTEGAMTMVDSLYPSPPTRVIRSDGQVVDEHPGNENGEVTCS